MARKAVGRSAAVTITIVMLATIALSAVALAPQLAPSTRSTSSGGSTSITSSLTGISTGSISQTSAYGGGTQGQVAVMATDPPVTASGVTSVVVQYDGLAVHEEGSTSTSGWVNLNSSGSLDLTGIVNVSKTIAVAKIATGSYDMVRLNITSATVTYHGQNYSATVRTGKLTVHMTGNVQVNSTASSAALIDVRTFVENSNSTNPQFFLSASAMASNVPRSDVTTASLQVGSKFDLTGRPWFTQFEDQTSAKLAISRCTLTSGSLSLTLTNSGGAAANIRTVIVTPIKAGVRANGSLPSSLAGSAVFTVDSSGSLSLQSILDVAGLNMSSSASSVLSFNGTVKLGLGLNPALGAGIVSGQQYLVTVVGDNAFASATVVAG